MGPRVGWLRMGRASVVVFMVRWLFRVVVVVERLAMWRRRWKEDWTMRVGCMYRVRCQ